MFRCVGVGAMCIAGRALACEPDVFMMDFNHDQVDEVVSINICADNPVPFGGVVTISMDGEPNYVLSGEYPYEQLGITHEELAIAGHTTLKLYTNMAAACPVYVFYVPRGTSAGFHSYINCP